MGDVLDPAEPSWMQNVKTGGGVPLINPGNNSSGWSSPAANTFMVRGCDYLTSRVKVPSDDYLLRPLAFDWIKGGSFKIGEVLKNPNSRLRKAIDSEFHSGGQPFIWAFNLQISSKENYSVVAYFISEKPFPEGSLVHQFLNNDDRYRNSRLKLIANIVKGPWIVRKAVGEQAVCIIGRALSCKYHTSENFLEVDMDVGSSMVANAIVHLAIGYMAMLTVDLAFLIEGVTEAELPEQLLGAVRFSELTLSSATPYEAPLHDPEILPLLPTSWWKSLGQGFSHLLHPGSQEPITSKAPNSTNSGESVANHDDCKD